MSARGTFRHVSVRASLATWGLVLVMVGLPVSAWSFDPLASLAAPFQDPLRTVPKRLETGATLPGDGSPPPCPAQKDFTMPLTLSEAVDLALCNNTQIQVAWATIKIQAAALGEARAAYLPTLSGNVNRIDDQTRYPDSRYATTDVKSRTSYATFNWRIFDFGGRAANQEAANQGLAAALANHDATLQKTLSGVIQAYFDAQSAKALLESKAQNTTIAHNTLETARRREAKGVSAQSDTLQATTALARVSLDRNRASGSYQKALSVLVYALGLPTHTQITLAADLGDTTEQTGKDLDAWLAITQTQHPAITAARAQFEAARQKVTATRSDSLPTLDFSANYFENGRPGQGLTPSHTQERTLGIALSIPLFDGFSRTYKIRGAEAQVEQRGAELQDTEHQILMEVVKAHADAIAALGNLQASESLLTAAQDALSVSQRKYEKGAADILEILNTQASLADARQERIRSLAEWRSARLRLLANAGQMGRAAVAPYAR
jgi:outer membrane protein